jgi:hypothetical protein
MTRVLGGVGEMLQARSTWRASATASRARSSARCSASHFIRLKTAWSMRCGVSALSRGARSDGDVVARKPAAAMTPDWQAATEFQARNPGNYFCCFAYSFPVSGIRFPKSRKNFLILNFYFLLSPVLLITDLFHPVRALAVQLFHNGDVRHGCGRRSAVPMLLTGREPDHIAWPDFLNRAAPTLRPSESGRNDQNLAQWMRVPCSAGARLKRDACAGHACRIGCLE